MLYEDETIRLDEDGLSIKRYYFPAGRPKRITFDEIKSVDVRPSGFATRWRLWGSTNLVNWFPLDMRRPKKAQLVELDLGKRVKPSITPDDANQIAALISARSRPRS